jgi:4-amino-4-deoxy-L-arabinose transferase-like glycosyltransferase
MAIQELQSLPNISPLGHSKVSTVSNRTKVWINVAMLLAVMAIALVVRVAYINQLGYNSDEAVYAGQGAAIAQVPILKDIFPVFRAHPLLFQFIVALSYKFGTNDIIPRLLSVVIGLATVFLVYDIGKRLYGVPAGLLSALFLAVMPYHVVVTRQVLLDGPMVFCTTLTLYFLVRFSQTEKSIWLISVGVGMGLSFLAKETSILMVGAIFAFLALSPKIKVRIIDIILSLIMMAVIMAPFPLSVSLAGGGSDSKTGQYLVWQLFRRPNHTWDFYPTVVPPAVGIGIIIAAVAGLLLLRKQNSWKERLLILWVITPSIFFELWPTKGFQYLLPAAPAVAILAGRFFAQWRVPIPKSGVVWAIAEVAMALLPFVIALSMFSNTWKQIIPSQSDQFIAGTGGLPGARETGTWIRDHVPLGSTFMAIGPSMANIVKFYGYRQAYGLSVSPNPLRRNPSYEAVSNPDFKIRAGDLQYLVWDSFSAARTTFFSAQLLEYVKRYNGRAIYTATVSVTEANGEKVEKPVIIVYEVHP